MVWRQLARVLDKHGVPILFVSLTVLLLNLSFLYRLKKDSYAQIEQIEALSEDFYRKTDAYINSGKEQALEGPYDFVYIDAPRIDALYNQLEPEMRETERTIKRDHGTSGKASANVGPVSGELDGKSETAESSSYHPIESSMERKCVEIMKLLDSTNRIRHYSNNRDWIFKRTMTDVGASIQRIRQGTPSSEDINLGETVDEIIKRNEERRKRLEAEMRAELESMTGFVIIGGDFAIYPEPGNSVQAWEEFSPKPSRVRFFGALSNADLKLQGTERAVRKMHMRIFATVMEPLNKDGVIRVRPLAAF
jgi:hypothetical protein